MMLNENVMMVMNVRWVTHKMSPGYMQPAECRFSMTLLESLQLIDQLLQVYHCLFHQLVDTWLTVDNIQNLLYRNDITQTKNSYGCGGHENWLSDWHQVIFLTFICDIVMVAYMLVVKPMKAPFQSALWNVIEDEHTEFKSGVWLNVMDDMGCYEFLIFWIFMCISEVQKP